MKVLRVRVDHYKNILNSTFVDIQPDVTCIVGKNESGKTAFLQALHRFYPAQASAKFDSQRQYPAWLEKQHRRQRNLDKHAPVSVIFKLDEDEIKEIERRLGEGCLNFTEIEISRTYDNKLIWNSPANEQAALNAMLYEFDLGQDKLPTTFAELEHNPSRRNRGGGIPFVQPF